MDLLQISNRLKDLSDQQIAALPHTSPEVPPYLMVAEMQRRDEMRKQYQAQAQRGPQTTVAQDLAAKMQQGPPMQQMPPQMGMRPGMGPPMPQMPQGLASMGRPPGMAQGGLIGYADGGPVVGDGDEEMATGAGQGLASLPTTVDQFNKLYPNMSMEEAIRNARASQAQDFMGPLAAELARQAAQHNSHKVDKWQALAKAGFAMAAEPTHSLGRALGVAGLAGLGDVQQQRDTMREQQMQNMAGRINVAKQQSSDQDRMMAAADAIYRNANSRSNTQAETLSANQRALLRDQVYPHAMRAKELDPTISTAEAWARGQDTFRRAQTAASAQLATTNARIAAAGKTPSDQLFHATVRAIGKRYGVEPDANGVVSPDDLPEKALDEVSALLHKRNPTEWGVILSAASGDPKKAFQLVKELKMAGRPIIAPGMGSGKPFSPTDFGLVPEE